MCDTSQTNPSGIARLSSHAWAFAAALGAIVAIVYWPALQAGFVSDDFELIYIIKNAGPFAVWTVNTGFLRPVIALSLAVDLTLFGVNPLGFHFTNLVFHFLNSLLVSAATWLFGAFSIADPRRRMWAAAVAGLLFGVLPSHAEAVAWISGRTDVISTFFALSAWCLVMGYDRTRNPGLVLGSLAALGLAFLAKESTLAMPIVIGLYAIWRWRMGGPIRHLVVVSAASGALLALYWVLRFSLLGGFGGYGTGTHLSPNLMVWLVSPPLFLGRMVWPCCWPLPALIEPMLLTDRITIMRLVYISSGLATILSVAGVALRRRSRNGFLGSPYVFLLLTSMVTQLPSLTLGLQVETRIGERFLYLPSAFLMGLVGLLALDLFRPKLAGIAGLILSSILGLSLWQANLVWQRAGTAAHRIVLGLSALPEDRPIRLVLPDHIQGAFVFRNALTHATALYGIHGVWDRPALTALADTDSHVIVRCDTVACELTVEDPGSHFVAGTLAPDVTATDDLRTIHIPLSPDQGLAVYSEGALRLIR